MSQHFHRAEHALSENLGAADDGVRIRHRCRCGASRVVIVTVTSSGYGQTYHQTGWLGGTSGQDGEPEYLTAPDGARRCLP